EQRDVIVVGATLSDRGNRAGLTKLRVVANAVDAKFSDGFCGRPCIGKRIIAARVLRRDAVDRSLRHKWQTALNGIFPITIGLNTGQALDDLQRRSAARGAIVGGKVEYVLRIEAGSDRRSLGVDGI